MAVNSSTARAKKYTKVLFSMVYSMYMASSCMLLILILKFLKKHIKKSLVLIHLTSN